MNKELYALIKTAQGSRTQNEFALHCGISSSTLSLILKGQRGFSSKLLAKIAKRAHNGVTYQDLMIAAGYLPEKFGDEEARETFSPKMQEAIDLVKEFDEQSLTTVIAMLKSAKEMQEQYRKDTII